MSVELTIDGVRVEASSSTLELSKKMLKNHIVAKNRFGETVEITEDQIKGAGYSERADGSTRVPAFPLVTFRKDNAEKTTKEFAEAKGFLSCCSATMLFLLRTRSMPEFRGGTSSAAASLEVEFPSGRKDSILLKFETTAYFPEVLTDPLEIYKLHGLSVEDEFWKNMQEKFAFNNGYQTVQNMSDYIDARLTEIERVDDQVAAVREAVDAFDIAYPIRAIDEIRDAVARAEREAKEVLKWAVRDVLCRLAERVEHHYAAGPLLRNSWIQMPEYIKERR